MKVNSQLTGRGKLGNVVYSQNAGVCIAREYVADVKNPSTAKQVNQRARLKLMSQLSASMAPVIAIPRLGLVSGRSRFISKNFDSTYADNGEASVTIENMQLTDGYTALPAIVAARDAQTGLVLSLQEDAAAQVSRVVYIVYKKTTERQLQLMASAIENAAGQNGTFAHTFQFIDGELVLFAYGMRDMNKAASAKYANMQILSGTDIASLVATRSLSSADYQFTKTRGTTLGISGEAVTPAPAGKANVYVSASGNGTVSGAGQFDIGSQVTVTATPAQGVNFGGWTVNGTPQVVSTSLTYTFTLQANTDLVALFYTPGGGNGGEEGDAI